VDEVVQLELLFIVIEPIATGRLDHKDFVETDLSFLKEDLNNNNNKGKFQLHDVCTFPSSSVSTCRRLGGTSATRSNSSFRKMSSRFSCCSDRTFPYNVHGESQKKKNFFFFLRKKQLHWLA